MVYVLLTFPVKPAFLPAPNF